MHSVHTRNRSLLNTLLDLLGEFRPAFSQQRVFERAGALVFGTLVTFARKTMTQLLTGLGELQNDWSAAYRLLSKGRFDAKAVSHYTLGATLTHVPLDCPYTIVADATHISRTSQKMPGTFWTRSPRTAPWAPGFERRQRFENICWLTPCQEGYRRAIPLRWLHAPSQKAVPSDDPPCREWEAGLQGIKWVRAELDAAGRTEQKLLAFADGTYDVNLLWKDLPANTVLVTRCAKNRKLWALPASTAEHRRGAPKKYGERLPAPEAMRREQACWQKLMIPVRGHMIQIKCRVVGPLLAEGAPNQPLFLLLVKGYHRQRMGRQRRRPPCQYLVNAQYEDGQWRLPLSLEELIEGTWHRWEVEVCHREIKAGFGLGQMQCWSKLGSTGSVSFMAWAYAVVVLAGYKAWNGLIAVGQRRAGRWWQGARRWSVNTLLQSYRAELWEAMPMKPVYARTPYKGPIMRRGEFADTLTLENAALGSLRG